MSLNGKWVMTLKYENWDLNNFGEFNSKEDLFEFIDTTSKEEIYETYLDETGEELNISNGIEIYIGQINLFTPHVCAYRVIEDVVMDAYDNCGEHAERYLDSITREQEDELEDLLNEVFNKWLRKYNLEPTFYHIENTEKIMKF